MEILQLSRTGVEAAAKKAAQILRNGGIVLYPTDTIYGLAVDATNARALRNLRELKGREAKKPVSIVVPSIEAIGTYGVMNDASRALAERFLPGALTLVLPAKDAVPSELVLAGGVGIRIPDDPFCLALARTFGKPYTATSANRSGREPGSTVESILTQFGSGAHGIDLVIDDGERKGRMASTVVTTVSGTPYVLREGAISRETLGL